MRKSILFLLFAVFSISNSINANLPLANEPLIVFHFDFNSVSLNENYVRLWLKKAAAMGYNSVLWEIENEVQWDICPECSSPDAFSKETFRSILNYSRELGLEPIPLLQTIGHAEYVLENENNKSFREDSTRYDCYCTTNPQVRIFLKNWIDEYLELFGDIKYFHLGGDEAYAFASCSKCKQQVSKTSENSLYVEHIADISQNLLKKGIRPGIWSDMILKYPNEIGQLNKEFVIWDWNYWDGDEIPERVMVWSKGGRLSKSEISDSILSDFPEIINNAGELNPFYTCDVLKRLKYDVILCSSSRSYGDGVFAGRNELHVSNIIGAAKKTVNLGLLGNCVTSWAVRIHNNEIQEPWFFLAPLTMKNYSLSKKELLGKTSQELFGVNGCDFFEHANKIGYSFTFANEKSTGIMWTGMKDSKPAPENYIQELINKMKSGNRWNGTVDEIKNSTGIISAGITDLNKFIPTTKKGIEVFYSWKRAGYFQYWQSIIANEIVNISERKPGINTSEMVKLIENIKEEYKNWAENWMTPTSAEQNAGLIYDAVQNLFKQNLID
ncbi:MAG: family 20 glycosylhydrolase [Bacteroidetes bacterium]|nr:family 20 glycosylhydrolase [Bacteroidota bacterium]MBU1116511.1 family 20 glycosylhydrolase [Bacteroidota bacterium]MBU1798768.1 family 20 glycosylhydrolase [Bacteroidota bacterium]